MHSVARVLPYTCCSAQRLNKIQSSTSWSDTGPSSQHRPGTFHCYSYLYPAGTTPRGKKEKQKKKKNHSKMSLDLKAHTDTLHCTTSVLQTPLGKLGKNNGFYPTPRTLPRPATAQHCCHCRYIKQFTTHWFIANRTKGWSLKIFLGIWAWQ